MHDTGTKIAVLASWPILVQTASEAHNRIIVLIDYIDIEPIYKYKYYKYVVICHRTHPVLDSTSPLFRIQATG